MSQAPLPLLTPRAQRFGRYVNRRNSGSSEITLYSKAAAVAAAGDAITESGRLAIGRSSAWPSTTLNAFVAVATEVRYRQLAYVQEGAVVEEIIHCDVPLNTGVACAGTFYPVSVQDQVLTDDGYLYEVSNVDPMASHLELVCKRLIQ